MSRLGRTLFPFCACRRENCLSLPCVDSRHIAPRCPVCDPPNPWESTVASRQKQSGAARLGTTVPTGERQPDRTYFGRLYRFGRTSEAPRWCPLCRVGRAHGTGFIPRPPTHERGRQKSGQVFGSLPFCLPPDHPPCGISSDNSQIRATSRNVASVRLKESCAAAFRSL